MKWFERHLNSVLLREKADVLRGTVLDLGCNHGLAALHLARRGERVVGVDLNRAALRRAVSQAGDFFPGRARNVLFLNAMMQALPLRSDSFDAVLLFDVLEHIYPDDYDRVFPEIFRVVKPGGALFLVTRRGATTTTTPMSPTSSPPGGRLDRLAVRIPHRGNRPDERPDERGSPITGSIACPERRRHDGSLRSGRADPVRARDHPERGAELADCLSTLAFADEIVVVDSAARTDRDIAREMGASEYQPWPGYGGRRTSDGRRRGTGF
jgi:SAM-dependent methyltransferase